MVVRNRAEKGEFWFLYSNKFYQSLASKPSRMNEPSMVAPIENSASDKESAGEEVQTETKATVDKWVDENFEKRKFTKVKKWIFNNDYIFIWIIIY